MRKPRQPPLPADDYKLAFSPRNGLQLNKVSPGKLEDAITNEAKLQIGSTGFKALSRLLVSEATRRALSFPQVAIPETTRSCSGEGQFQATFRFRFQAQDLIATMAAIPWQDLEPWTFRKWQEGKQGSSAGHAAGEMGTGCFSQSSSRPVDTELAQAHAHIRRLTEENATLKAEITYVHAEFVTLK
ncbi:hypothetical protein HPB49_005751 [Dermacentor silvarum]|uniref:Uncharacterized protein n=1 Tax=Dermacentor silvarum TaxID=543639 RepID=A0ACB8C7D7_DERSI|nr:hypothetical protein HPB49_005751 [Dermacentor silvarum]